jgi:uncharacterized protein (DUF1778 family)
MSSAVLKTARVELKTTDGLKQMLSKAAMLSGLDLTAFVLSSAEEKARDVIEHHDSLSLSAQEQERFLSVLTNPPKAPVKLKKLMAMERLNER